MIYFQTIILIFAVLYAFFCFFAFYGLIIGNKQGHPIHLKNAANFPFVSLLIPVKNEARTLPDLFECLSAQNYPEEKMEIIVIDDASDDNTADIVSLWKTKIPSITLVPSYDRLSVPISGKKGAILAGLKCARGQIILTTDADCTMGPGWINSMAAQFTGNTGLVAGRTHFRSTSERSLIDKLEAVDFLSIISTAAGLITAGKPVTCNASNLAYIRQAFDEADGYNGMENLVSGDDDLLLQKISRSKQYRIRFNFDPESFVFTTPVGSIRKFIEQRSRWASKIPNYPNLWNIAGLALVYSYFVLLFVSIPLFIIGFLPWETFFLAWSLKVIPDGFIIITGASLFNRRDLIRYYPLAELLHVPYILSVVPAGLCGFFIWKGTRGRTR